LALLSSPRLRQRARLRRDQRRIAVAATRASTRSVWRQLLLTALDRYAGEFYSRAKEPAAVITLDATRPGPQISQIAQAIVAELSRVGGAKVTLKLDIDAEAPADFRPTSST